MSRFHEFVDDYIAHLIIIAAIIIFLTGIFIIPKVSVVVPMPTQVDVNGIQWRVQVVDKITASEPDRVGYTDCATRRVYISKAAIRPQTTLMHELTHATVCAGSEVDFGINNLYFNSKTNDGHEGIYAFTEMWAELLTRNPQLANYLGQDIK